MIIQQKNIDLLNRVSKIWTIWRKTQ